MLTSLSRGLEHAVLYIPFLPLKGVFSSTNDYFESAVSETSRSVDPFELSTFSPSLKTKSTERIVLLAFSILKPLFKLP